jgi:hypothetical protein
MSILRASAQPHMRVGGDCEPDFPEISLARALKCRLDDKERTLVDMKAERDAGRREQ